jgi:hypothetical protein
MRRIELSQAAPGMVLARNVENDKGMVLCTTGTPLSDALLGRLENVGVSHVSVEGHPVSVEGETSLAQEMEALERRFEKVDTDPLMLKIRELLRKQLKLRYGDESVLLLSGKNNDGEASGY